MANQRLELEVRVNAETGQLEVVGQKLKSTGKEAKQTGESFSGLSKSAGGLLKSLLPIASAAGVIMFFKNAVNSAEEHNEALRRLQGALGQTGEDFDSSRIKANQWGDAIQATTRFSATEGVQSVERLARSVGDLEQAQAGATLAMNLAVQSGKSLGETTAFVSDLMTGQTRAVMMAQKEYGAYIRGAEDAEDILAALAETTRDAAVAEESFTKTKNQTTNAFKAFAQQIGDTVLPAVEWATRGLTALLKIIENIGSAIAGLGVMLVQQVQGMIDIVMALVRGNFREAGRIARETARGMSETFKETAADMAETWKGHQEEHEQVVRDSSAVQLQVRRQLTADELALEKNKAAEIKKIVAGTTAATVQMEADALAMKAELTDQELEMRRLAAIHVADLAVQTLATVNAMSEKGTKSEINRAKAILALEKTIAIARAVSEGMKAGPFAKAVVAANIALVVAQFAMQSRALDRAASSFQQGQSSVTVSTPLPGSGGGTIDRTFGSPVGGGGGGGGGGFSAAGGGGGGAGTVINMGGVVVNIQFDKLGIDNIRVVMREITERTRQGTLEGVQMAVALSRAADKNEGVAL